MLAGAPGPVSILKVSVTLAPVSASLVACFAALPDPRRVRTCRHSLEAVLFMAFCAVLGGADSWVEVEEFGRDHQAWLARRMALPHGIPSHDPCGRVVARLDPKAFQMGFVAWMQAVHALTTAHRLVLAP